VHETERLAEVSGGTTFRLTTVYSEGKVTPRISTIEFFGAAQPLIGEHGGTLWPALAAPASLGLLQRNDFYFSDEVGKPIRWPAASLRPAARL
jgi:hypothetical protein